MRQKSVHPESPSERIVKSIRRATRKRHSPEEKIRIVLDGLRGESSIAELCRREGIADIAQKNFTVSRAEDVVFDVVERMWRRGASMSIVTKGSGHTPRGPHVVGMISKEHIADSVADSIRPYGTEASGPV